MADFTLNDDGTIEFNKKKKKKTTADFSIDDNGKVKFNGVAATQFNQLKQQQQGNKIETARNSLKGGTPTKNSWFKSGAFSDGYQFGDLTKTIVGTSANIQKNVTKGAIGIGEKAVDAGAWVVGKAGGLLGFDDFQESTSKFIKKDLIDEEKLANRATVASPTGSVNALLNSWEKGKIIPYKNAAGVIVNGTDITNDNSILGEKSQGLVQSAGQLGGTVALQAIGVPWWLTTGATTFGGEAENALKSGATYNEAGISAGITALGEVLTEKISGGISFGGNTLDQGLKNVIKNKITNKTAQAFTKWGIDAVGEAGEEVLSEVISNVGKKITYEDEKTWKEALASEEALESYLDSAIGGAVLGGGINAGRLYSSVKNGKDYDTGLKEDQQTNIRPEENRTSDIAPVTSTTPVQSVEEIDKQIVALEAQLNSNLSDAEYDRISNQIKELEIQAEQIEQNGPTTTQEVETNSLVDAPSNTLNTGKTLQEQLETQANDIVQKEQAEKQAMIKMFEDYVSENNITNPTEQDIQNSIDSYDVYDATESFNQEAQQKYVDTIKEHLKETNSVKSGQQNVEQYKSKTFDEDYKKFESGQYTDNDNVVILDSTPDYFYNLGYETNKPVVISMQKLNTIMKEPKGKVNGKNQHGITKEVIEQLPYAISNPLNVIKNPKFRNRFVVITELSDQYGDIVQVPIEMDTKGHILNVVTDVNRITSTYGKETYDGNNNIDKPQGYMEYNKDNIVYDIDNDTQKRATNPRLQLPNVSSSADNNITSNEKNVNIPTKQELDNTSSVSNETTSKVQEDLAPIKEATKELKTLQKEVSKQVTELKETMADFKAVTQEQLEDFNNQYKESLEQLYEMTAPVQQDVTNDNLDTTPLNDRTVKKITKVFKKDMKLNKVQAQELDKVVKELSSNGNLTPADVLEYLETNYSETSVRNKNEDLSQVKSELRNLDNLTISQDIAQDVDIANLRTLAKGNLRFKIADRSNVDVIYDELSGIYPHLFPSDIKVPSQQFEALVEIASTPIYSYEEMQVPHEYLSDEADFIYDLINDYRAQQKIKDSEADYKAYAKTLKGVEAPSIEEEVIPTKEAFTEKVEESNKEIKNELGYIPKDPTRAESYEYDEEIAEVLDSEPTTEKQKKNKISTWIKTNILDKGMVFEDLSIKTKNRELQAKWDYTLTSEARAQYVIGNGHVENGKRTSKSLNAIMKEVHNTKHTKAFYDYMYHKLNVDRMTLADRFEGMENKPVFGYSVTADISQQKVDKYEATYPEFMDFAQDVYNYVNADRAKLVKDGVISQETADLWSQMYPHYVPIRRADHAGNAINVALDTNRTGINAPVKKATGGNSDILPLFDTMAQRTIQTYRATAKNNFGKELKKTLKAKGIKSTTTIDEAIDTVDNQEGLLQEGKNGSNPTFTVFENGERVTYEITQEMYEALKPISDSSLLSKTFKPANIASSIHRGVLTQYNPIFAITNGIKDAQDILINSQHSAKTYAKIPEATSQLLNKGYWYREYMRNGGEQNSYFDSQDNNFDTQHKGIAKALDWFPLKQIAQLNDFIERVPRLAEYIASREAGKSVEVAMLDAARVTTNFKAGGNATKWANRNGATFLNASVQGVMQQVRNVREANMNGFKGWANLATKFAVAGVPAMILNALLWGDDEEYEELSDYVKQNYYVVGKYGDGQFIRIPKGRTVAVIQDAFEQVSNGITGDDEVDLNKFLDLVVTNLAPNDPLENNILSPIKQVLTNESWYGEELVPQRLQDLPAAEQYDETTDSFSRWLGEKTDISPYKINYLLNQYSGVVGDLVLPSITPKATQQDDSAIGTILAPLKDKFTVDGVMKNQNVSDFYSTSEKLTTGAKASGATDEDILKNKYINSVKTELNDLYAQKREIQNSDLPKGEKYKQAKEVQKQINEITKDALSKYSEGNYTDNYGIIDDREYYKKSDGDWTAVNSKEKAALNEMNLSIEDKATYFDTTQELNSISEKYQGAGSEYSLDKKREVISAIQNTKLNEEARARLYKKEYNTDDIDKVLTTNIGLDTYFDYILQDIKADYNAKGNAIPNSRKNKVVSYVNQYDLSIAQKAILIKSTNTFKFNDYNTEVVEYIGNLDIPYEEKVELLEDLDMMVSSDGTVRW